MTSRQMVCSCEDVTVQDVEEAFRAGHTDMESLKRFTGLATGICQGRSCMATAAAMLRTQSPAPTPLRPTTPRPPLSPIRLGALAVGGELPAIYPGPKAPALRPVASLPLPPGFLPPLPKEASVVVVGGGIMGLATAYHLARLGMKNVVVLERSYLNAGASGRNGGGMRMQWSTEQNITLMQESMALCRNLATELGINIWLRQGGYLFVARKQEQVEAAQRNITLQNSLGVPTRWLSPKACQELAPQLHCDDLLGGAYHAGDGVIFPWPFLWGYAAQARRLGVHVATFTEVAGVSVQAGRVVGVRTSRGNIRCDLLINAAAAWSGDIAAMVGATLPSHPERHEIMVTESLKPFLTPLVSELDSGLYFSQSMRGEIVAGLGDPQEPHGLEMRSSMRFITRIARGLCQRMPHLANVQLVRQWAGCYDVTADRNPLIGELPGVAGFFQLSGFVGHGFMMAPAVSKRVGAYLAKGKDDPIFHAYRPQRFQDDMPDTPRETLIIG